MLGLDGLFTKEDNEEVCMLTRILISNDFYEYWLNTKKQGRK